jgi:hypothetical protein
MIHYKLMAETVRRNGFFTYDPVKQELNRASESDKERFWKRMEAARVFVFSQGKSWPVPKTIDATVKPDLAVPFETTFLENMPREDGTSWMIRATDDFAVGAVLLVELGPGQFDGYFLAQFDKAPNKELPRVAYYPFTESHGNVLAWVCQIFLDRLYHSDIGVEDVKERIKLGSGQGKTVHTIRHIVRVVPKGEKATTRPAFGGKDVNWSHRWAVRGHWRKHDGLGKNRAGEYCVQGFTWVTEHLRGPEEAPLIQKVRVVG